MNAQLDKKLSLLFLLCTLILLIFSSLPAQAHPAFTRVYSLDTSVYHFKLDQDGSRIKFFTSKIFFDKFSWINNDTVKFYNLKLTDVDDIPNPLSISLTGPANITFTTLFDGNLLEATIDASTGTTSVLSFSSGFYRTPAVLTVDGVSYKTPMNTKSEFDSASFTTWYHDDSALVLYVKIVHSSPASLKIDWTAPEEEPAPTSTPAPAGPTPYVPELPPLPEVFTIPFLSMWLQQNILFVTLVALAVLLASLFCVRCLCRGLFSYSLGSLFLLLGSFSFLLGTQTADLKYYQLGFVILLIGSSFFLLQWHLTRVGRCKR